MPSSVHATGICAFSANALSSSQASAIRTPCPARISGRFAWAISFAAVLSCFGWPSRLGRKPGRPAMTSSREGCSAVVSCCRASLVMSMWTGPGRPCLGEVERLGDDVRDVVGVAHQVVVLGHRQRDAGDVDLLERVLADERRRARCR